MVLLRLLYHKVAANSAKWPFWQLLKRCLTNERMDVFNMEVMSVLCKSQVDLCSINNGNCWLENNTRVSHPFAYISGLSAQTIGQLFESMRSVPPQQDLIGLLDLYKRCLSILPGVVVWMPCLGQFPIASSYLFKRGLCFQWQYLQWK